MKRFLVRRLLYCVPVLAGIVFVTFVLFRVVGGDPVDQLAGKYATAEQKRELRRQLGFDRPLWPDPAPLLRGDWPEFADNQLFAHFRRTFTLDFGRSRQYHREIGEMILSGAGPSLSLTVPAFLIGIFLQLTIAVLAAFRRGGLLDRLLVFACLIGLSVPYLALIILGQTYLAGKLGWYPVYGYPQTFGPSVAVYVALPVLLGVAASLGGGVRFYRTVILDEVQADYVRTARAKGLSPARIMFGHVLKNAMIPVITQLAVVFPFLFLGSLLLERFFSIPGLGYMLVDAVNASDWPVINALTFIESAIYLGAVILTDIGYALVDPRVSLE
ncbi:MAG TPA: ABC transporter permease [bacterium]|nr:ABC transporter permease [bacterium]HPQ67171.1 ABC transporter permease [bacterium]